MSVQGRIVASMHKKQGESFPFFAASPIDISAEGIYNVPKKTGKEPFCDGTYREHHDDADVHALHVHASAYAKFGSLCFINFQFGTKRPIPELRNAVSFPALFSCPAKNL